MSNQTNKRQFIQLSESEVNKTDGWLLNGKEMVPFSRLSDEQLQKALFESEAKELRHHNRSSFHGILAEKLMEEADRRNLSVEHYNTEFTAKTHETEKHETGQE